MSDWETVDATAGGSPDVPRDRWGRPLIIPLGGGKPVAYTRVTTLASAIENQYNLTKWKQQQTVAGICKRKDLYLKASALGLCPDDDDKAAVWKPRMDEVIESAMEAAFSSAASNTGTAWHIYTEAIDRGEEVNVPPEFATHITNYRRITAPLHPIAIEQFLVIDEIQAAGTADRILQIDGEEGLFIGDVKTGDIKYQQKMSMQLACYAHGVIYDIKTGARQPIEGIRQDKGLIIALNAKTGDCDLHWIDIASGWQAVDLAIKVRQWQSVKNLTRQADFSQPTLPSQREISQAKFVNFQEYAAALMAAASIADLMAAADQLQKTGVWNSDLNNVASNRWGELSGKPPF